MSNNQSALAAKRHSLAHLLAAAVLQIYPDAKPTLGPSIDNGFYYDFDFSVPISEADLPKIETKMRELLPSWSEFIRQEMTVEQATAIFANNQYKLELIKEINDAGQTITFYRSGDFTDLCRGGHVTKMSDINPDSFKLDHLAGAYWRGNEKNKMLTRIYGLAFETNKDLADYLKLRAEAEKRDHKKLGRELGLFTVSDLVGKGLPMYLPKGNIIKTELENFIRKEKENLGYSFVTIPHIAKKELYIRSGHLGKYDAMMPIMTDENGEEFVMKAMNCPHHFEIYNAEPHSYRDLPLRLAENTTVYRNEKSGELSGLLRVKNLTQDDTHHFLKLDQIESEIEMIFGLMKKVYSLFGFNNYKVEISIRDPKNKEKYFGNDEVWAKAENILITAAQKMGLNYNLEEGEAAFYGPKIDIKVNDSLGREWQLTTIQLDFNQPENFQMDYTGEDGKKHRVVVLHVAILGSFERFMGIIIEHFAGAFPLWLSPVQVKILPVGEAHFSYCEQLSAEFKQQGLRVEIDLANETVGNKIRKATQEKVPYSLVIGDKELNSQQLTIRVRGQKDLFTINKTDFVTKLKQEINDKK